MSENNEKKMSKIAQYLSSYRGKILFNFFYGFGASVAILGTLFKILHLDGANVMLAVGLGTEVLMFAISAFEPPFRNYHWEEVFPVLKSRKPEDRPNLNGIGGSYPTTTQAAATEAESVVSMSAPQVDAAQNHPQNNGTQAYAPQTTCPQTSPSNAPYADITPGEAVRTYGLPADVQLSDEDARTLADSIKRMGEAVKQLNTMANIAQVTNEYMGQMDSLNLNLKGLNTIYEIQLKSISSQIDTIDRVNQGLLRIRDMYENSAMDSERLQDETNQMAEHLAQLNQVYARMLQAMIPANPFAAANMAAQTGSSDWKMTSTETLASSPEQENDQINS